jgi:TolB-like protein/tetratricopeptide (TPR) repeat protein
MSFFAELKRRSVFRVAIGYVGVSWLILQVIDVLFGIFDYETDIDETIVIVLAIGFIPAMILAWAFELTPEGIKRDAETDHDAPAMRSFGRRIDRIVIAILSVAVVFFAVDKFVLQVAPEQPELRGIAVMPFLDSSADAGQEYLATGITDQLLTALDDIRLLRVIARTSVLSYAGKDVDAKTIADELGVAHILEGSVQVAGNRIRVTAALIDASNEARLWSDNFEGTLEDIFDIQDQIAAAVVDGIEVELFGAEPRRAERLDLEAYKLYVRGEHLVEDRVGGESYDEALESAIPLLEQVVAIEPEFINGWLKLMKAQIRLWNLRGGTPDGPLLAGYEEAMGAARRLNPDHPVVVTWDATARFFEGGHDQQAIASEIERAIEAAPTNPDVMLPARQFVMSIGRVDKALAMAELAVDRDPKCKDCWYVLSQILRDVGRLDESLEAAEVAVALGIQLDYSLAKTRLYKHEPEAMLEISRSRSNFLDHSSQASSYAMALYTAGRQDEFEQVFAEIRDRWGETAPLDVAMICAWSGQIDSAFGWLDRAIALDIGGVQRLHLSPFLYNLRGDPRWNELLRRIERHPEQLAKIEFDPDIPEVRR